ncbi:MAG: stage III sporulation protein AD [Ruminococcaceae bacterium]|nr:stage III sporulation protein AD [Oscillospiraceae bacterium]
MMNLLQMIGLGMTGALLSLLIKEHKPVLGVCVGMVTATVIFTSVLAQLSSVIDVVNLLAERLSVNEEYITIIIRIIGMTYVAQFASEICRDAGQNAVARKIELAGKIVTVATGLPILLAVLNLLLGILPG